MSSLTFILLLAGFALLILGAELLVRGASRLALTVGISPLVVGLTVVAYGTSAPELAVSVQSTYQGAVDIALGNVVGSNIANILLILGLSATLAPLVVAQQLVRLDVPLMIGLSVLLFVMGLDGLLGRLEGLVLFAGAISYTIFVIRQSRREAEPIQQEYGREFSRDKTRASRLGVVIQVGLVLVGLVLLVLGARWLVDGAVAIASFYRVSELIIGLTIVAVGTSLPELATSIVATLRGERDIAVGNVIGSNIFNILTVLGLSSLVAPSGLEVAASALRFDIPVMIVAAVACLPIFFTGNLIARWEGLLFLGYYVAYVFYLVLAATQAHSLSTLNLVMVTFVLPLTIVTLFVSVIRTIRLNQSGLAAEKVDG
jgi:cation:H+ antiporter